MKTNDFQINLNKEIVTLIFIFIATAFSSRWNTTGITVAGSSGGSSGVAANLLSCPYGLTLDSSNSLYIADYDNNRIQRWLTNASNGTTLAGAANGTAGASATVLNNTVGIVLDSSDNMYFTDRSNHRVVYWASGASSGTTIAGTTGRRNGKRHVQKILYHDLDQNICLIFFTADELG
jgi:hypothetical protein